MIEIKNLTKKYKNGEEESVVVNDINLKISRGDFIAIVGQSGSGKSTLMNILGGLDEPTSGEVIVFNQNISQLKDKAKSKFRKDVVGFVFQDFNLEGEKSVLDNVSLPMIFAGVSHSERKKRAMEALEKVNLLDRAHYKANQLSGGQKQRVAIARALVNNPQILLADEPTGNLDSKNGTDIMNLLNELNSKGYTIIMVTHNTEQSLNANKVIRMVDGKITSIKETGNENSKKSSIQKEEDDTNENN